MRRMPQVDALCIVQQFICHTDILVQTAETRLEDWNSSIQIHCRVSTCTTLETQHHSDVLLPAVFSSTHVMHHTCTADLQTQ